MSNYLERLTINGKWGIRVDIYDKLGNKLRHTSSEKVEMREKDNTNSKWKEEQEFLLPHK